ncbi:MAG: PocR ligand-binding domain-containing protein [Desulfuromonadales bacterium]|nr:PocR ligand-binding domain-containing protein [Desulfuromonadales bacterium]
MIYQLKELLDIDRLQDLLHSLGELQGMPSSIVDNEGTILAASSWQQICKKFHCSNEVTGRLCRESFLRVSAACRDNLPPHSCQCPLGLMDASSPIIVEGRYFGCIRVGQFLMQPPDHGFFLDQARRYGFNETDYLEAVMSVPIYTEEQIHANLTVIAKLTRMLVESGLQRMRYLESEARLREALHKVETQSVTLQQSAANHAATLNATVDGILAVGTNREILFSNQRFSELWNIPSELLASADDATLLDHVKGQVADPDGFMDATERLYNSAECSFDTINFRDGRIIERFSLPVHQGESRTMGRVWSFREVTARKRAEEELITSNKLLQTIINTVPMRVFWKDTQLRYLGCNHTFARDAGVASPNELIGKDDFQLVWHDHAEQYRADDRLVMESGRPKLFYDERQTTPAGEVIWLRTSKVPLVDEALQTFAVLGIYEDITEHRLAEIELKASQQRLSTLIEALPDAVFLKDGNGRWQFVNSVGLELFDLKKKCWRNKTQKELIDLQPEAAAAFLSCLSSDEQTWLSAIPQHFEEHITAKDGTTRIIDFTKIPLFEEDGGRKGMVVVGKDVTVSRNEERNKLEMERQLQHTQKLESLGVLAGGIAHDFNNILAVIIGNCSLARFTPDKAEEFIPAIESAAERAAGLCRQMLAYAGKAETVCAPFDIRLLTEDMVSMLKSSISKNVTISLDIRGGMSRISGDSSQIRQVVMNLIINAAEAIGESAQGTVMVSLAPVTITAGHQGRDYHGTPIQSGEYLCLEVTDTGCGMDEETARRIFEPFFTTKFSGRGLGMSAVLGIISSHNGALQLFSQPGRGTTFKVFLPVPEERAAESGKRKVGAADRSWCVNKSILLVDDEDQLRAVTKRMLERLGFTVFAAVDGLDALDTYQKNAASIDLVLTDISMPQMDGYELVRELNMLNPSLPIIVSSGFGEKTIDANIDQGMIAAMIGKPYRFDQLLEAMNNAVRNCSSN